MKNKFLLMLLAVAFAAVASLSAFKNAEMTAAEKAVTVSEARTLDDGTVRTTYADGGVRNYFADGSEDYVASGSIYYEKTWALDTITDAENDTLVTTGSMNVMYSDFEYNYSIIRTNISGTTNVALKVEQTNYTSDTAWATLATGSATTATIEYLIGDCTAVRTRYIVDGTGTQSSSYRLRLVLKKKT